jgi:L-malate glycosyltransferase
MKILWVVNIIVSPFAKALGWDISTVFGGWIEAASAILGDKDGIQLFIAAHGPVKQVEQRQVGNITYFAIPESSAKTKLKPYKKQLTYCRDVIKAVNPDVLHIHGTEYPLGIGFIEVNSRQQNPCSVFVSIQGILPLNTREYYGGLFNSSAFLALPKIICFLVWMPVAIQRYRLGKRITIEQRYLSSADYICGRTVCDREYTQTSRFRGKYLHSGEVMRETFYHDQWDLDHIERYAVYVGNTSYSLKGFHHILEAVSLIRPSFPDIKIYVAGDMHQPVSALDIKHLVGYSFGIRQLLIKLKLDKQVIFTGLLNAESVKNKMLSCHISIIASSAENSPNVLGEAMLLGLPTAASYTGGIPSMAADESEVLFFPPGDPVMLASRIKQLFLDDEKARNLSRASRKRARSNHSYMHIEKLIQNYHLAIQKKISELEEIQDT